MMIFGMAGKGTYWRALYLARGLSRRGHDVTVLSTSPHGRLRFETRQDARSSVTLVEAPDLLWGPLRSGWDIWNVARRIHWGRDRQYDVVHAFESRPVSIYPALYWQRRRGAKLILDWCDWFGRGGSVEERPNPAVRALLRPVETFFEDHFRRQGDGATVINGFLGERAAALGVDPRAIMRLPNGSNVEELIAIPRAEARRALDWPEDLRIVGYLGAIFRRDAQLMAQAFDQIHRAEPQTRLLSIGYLNVRLETMVEVPGAVWQTGGVRYDQIGLYLSACDVCWLPLCDSGANRGRYPLKLNDYMAAARPVVATRVGEIAPSVERGEFGLLADDRPEDLARQVLWLFRHREEAAEMGRLGRQVAEAELRWDDIAGDLAAYYERVLASKENA
jgi:glycosyltransferase involved in cell wall biosynthesis